MTFGRFRGLLLAVAAALLLCSPAPAQVFDRTDPQREVDLGRRVAREVEREIPLSRNAALQERVRRIGSALVDQLPRKAYPYEFKVLASPEVNAFAAPGGFIYFFEGLLNRVPDDDALAFIVGHEIAHASHRHYHQTVEKMRGVSIAAMIVSTALNDSTVASIAHTLIHLKYSREHEEEADRIGLDYMWGAGFDLQGAVRAARLLEELDKKNATPEYLRSHPRGKDRLARVEKLSASLRERPRPAPNTASVPGESAADSAGTLGTLPEVVLAPNPLYPLAVGNTWTYTVRSAGSETSYTYRIAGAIRVGDGTAYRSETTLARGIAVSGQVLTTATALWRRSRPTDPASTWEMECLLAASDSGAAAEGFTIAASGPITVPCGTFESPVRVRKQAGGRTYDIWFARGVGMIRRECVETGVVETLASYRVEEK